MDIGHCVAHLCAQCYDYRTPAVTLTMSNCFFNCYSHTQCFSVHFHIFIRDDQGNDIPNGNGNEIQLGNGNIVRSRINVNGNDPYLRGEKIPMDLCDIVLFHWHNILKVLQKYFCLIILFFSDRCPVFCGTVFLFSTVACLRLHIIVWLCVCIGMGITQWEWK